MTPIDATHEPSRKIRGQSANSPDTAVPIQNLPLGIFSRDGIDRRPGVAIGAHILDLRALDAASLLPEDLSLLLKGSDLDPLLAAVGSEERRVGKECVRTCRVRWGR